LVSQSTDTALRPILARSTAETLRDRSRDDDINLRILSLRANAPTIPIQVTSHNYGQDTFVVLANTTLGIKLRPAICDEVDLRFKEIDMMFLVMPQLL
jgi:hypothetical protein